MKTKCEHVGPNRTKCERSVDHEGLHSSSTSVFAEYGRKRTDYHRCEWNNAGEIAPPEWGCSVPLADFNKAKGIIAKVLLPEARNTLEAGKVIEIRMKLEKDGIAWFHKPSPEDCPDGFEDQYSMQQEPLFDFDGFTIISEPLGYYLLARIKL